MSDPSFENIAGIHDRSKTLPHREKCLMPDGERCTFRIGDACCNSARGTDQWCTTCPNFGALEALRVPPPSSQLPAKE